MKLCGWKPFWQRKQQLLVPREERAQSFRGVTRRAVLLERFKQDKSLVEEVSWVCYPYLESYQVAIIKTPKIMIAYVIYLKDNYKVITEI